MRLKYLLLPVVLLIAIQGHSQSFSEDQHRIPQKASLKLIEETLIDNDYKYGNFMVNPENNQLYITASKKLLSVTNVTTKPKPKEKKQTTADIVEFAITSAEYNRPRKFVSLNSNFDGFAVVLPQHHLLTGLTQVLRSKGVNKQRILDKINELDLVTAKQVATKGGGFNMVYDRVFIYDGDKDKFLIIWHKNNRLHANYLTNNGEWLMPEPKIIHKDVACVDKNGAVHYRDLDGATDKSSIVRELNIIKENDKYYIGYNMSTWEDSKCFVSNLSSCHLSILSSDLNVVKTVQLPDRLETGKWFFATDSPIKIHKNGSTICAVIQSPNAGEDKLFIQLFDDKLNPVTDLIQISDKTKTYADLIPVTLLPDGFLFTYKAIRKNTTDVYTQFIGIDGKLGKPVSVFTIPDNTYFSSMEVIREKDNLIYYFLRRETKPEKTYLAKYSIKFAEYRDAERYIISRDNWQNNSEIRVVDNIVRKTESDISAKKLVEFRTYSDRSEKTKTANVDSSFLIRKYTESYGQKPKNTKHVYYDDYSTLRYIQVIQERSGIVRAYFNEDADLLWVIRENEDGSVITDLRNSQIRRYIKPIDKPFDEFHN